MAVGTIPTRILTDIANAIRFKAGVATTYKPREMAAAVAALDGSDAGEYAAQPYKELEAGVVSESVFAAIADAIRGQNGESTLYAPGEMAAAILALSWAVAPRAVLLADGSLEFNRLAGVRSASGGAVVQAFEVSAAGYASAGARPWDSVKAQVTKVVIDSSFASAGITNCAHWFSGFTNLVEVSGFENLSGMTVATQMFATCSALETVYATSFTNAITSGASMFYGCKQLVGGSDSFVPTNSSAAAVCKLGAGGVLTDPSADNREWCHVHLYSNGLLRFGTDAEPVDADSCVGSGRLCVTARYKSVGVLPCYEQRAAIGYAFFDSSMAGFGEVHMDYWFYGLAGLKTANGSWNLVNVASMRYAFNSCTALEELYLTGLDGSKLTDVAYAFAGCTALRAIYADPAFALGAGASGMQTFYGCTSLVGGAGTAYSADDTGYSLMRIDAEGAPGYLTAWGG